MTAEQKKKTFFKRAVGILKKTDYPKNE